jgi:hypothetical protein
MRVSLCLRDEEAAGSNPATPTEKRQVTRHLVACYLHYAFPGVRPWAPAASEQKVTAGSLVPRSIIAIEACIRPEL